MLILMSIRFIADRSPSVHLRFYAFLDNATRLEKPRGCSFTAVSWLTRSFILFVHDRSRDAWRNFVLDFYALRAEGSPGMVRRDNVISRYLRNSSSRFNLRETRRNRGERMVCLVGGNYTEQDDTFRLNSG